MFINTDTEFLVMNKSPTWYLREITGSTGTWEGLRKLVIASVNDQGARLVKREVRPGRVGPQVVETVLATIGINDSRMGIQSVKYVLVRTEQLAPDGEKTLVFLAWSGRGEHAEARV